MVTAWYRKPADRPAWKGEVLPKDDVRAWTDTLAFRGVPEQGAVTAHVERLEGEGLLRGVVPVLWEFGRVYWEKESDLEAV